MDLDGHRHPIGFIRPDPAVRDGRPSGDSPPDSSDRTIPLGYRGTDHHRTDADAGPAEDHDLSAATDRDVHRRVVLEVPIDEAWSLLTDPDELAAWWGEGTTIELEPAGDARFREEGAADRQGRVVEVKPGRRLVFDWWPEDPEVDDPASRVTIELVPCPFGTIVTVTECVLLPLDLLPVLVAPRPTFLPSPWGPGPSARARTRSRVLVLA